MNIQLELKLTNELQQANGVISNQLSGWFETKFKFHIEGSEKILRPQG